MQQVVKRGANGDADGPSWSMRQVGYVRDDEVYCSRTEASSVMRLVLACSRLQGQKMPEVISSTISNFAKNHSEALEAFRRQLHAHLNWASCLAKLQSSVEMY